MRADRSTLFAAHIHLGEWHVRCFDGGDAPCASPGVVHELPGGMPGLVAAGLGLAACSGSANPAASLDSGSGPPGSGGDGAAAADVGTVDSDASAHDTGPDGSPFDASMPPSDGAPSDGAFTDGGSWVPEAGGNVTVLFAQPSLPSIAGNFFVQQQPAVGAFALILWQTSPDTADGGTVPVSWDAGDNTGFYPPQPASTYQTGFQDVYGTTTGQIAGDTVGAYLNSSDSASSKEDKEMITPQVKLGTPYAVPFANAANILTGSLELQVPVAEDGQSTATEKSNTYANVDLLFATSNAADPLDHPRREPLRQWHGEPHRHHWHGRRDGEHRSVGAPLIHQPVADAGTVVGGSPVPGLERLEDVPVHSGQRTVCAGARRSPRAVSDRLHRCRGLPADRDSSECGASLWRGTGPAGMVDAASPGDSADAVGAATSRSVSPRALINKKIRPSRPGRAPACTSARRCACPR